MIIETSKNRHHNWKGLQFDNSGSKLLAINFLENIKLLWVVKHAQVSLKIMNLGML